MRPPCRSTRSHRRLNSDYRKNDPAVWKKINKFLAWHGLQIPFGNRVEYLLFDENIVQLRQNPVKLEMHAGQYRFRVLQFILLPCLF